MDIKNSRGAKYAVQFIGWTLLLLLATEIFTRLAVVSFPSFDSKVNGGGVEIYGEEGYGIIYYLPNIEIATPYSGGENIITLGDSYTQARQIPFWSNFSSVAEKELRAGGYDLDVRNFGFMGTALPYYIGIGDSLMETYKPRLVIIQIATVDFAGSKVFDKNAPYYFVEKAGQLVLKSRPKQEENWQKLPARIAEQPHFSFYNRPSIETLLNIRRSEMDPKLGNPVNNAPTSMKNRNIGQDELLSQGLALIDSTYKNIPIIFILRPDFSKKQLTFSYDLETRKLVTLIKQHPLWSVLYIDDAFNQTFSSGLSPIGFGNTDPFSGHWNAKGHEIVGKLLAERIAQLFEK